MKKIYSILSAVLLLSMSVAAHAIQVNVSTTSNEVYALGFTVNGTEYGAAGNHYSKSDLPAGAEYKFGVRVGGLIIDAKDVGCVTINESRPTVVLNTDTNVTLLYDAGNDKCYIQLS